LNFDPVFVQYVRNYSKIFKKVCNTAKALYISKKIKQSKNKIKATWNVINNETGRTKRHIDNIHLKINNKVITDNYAVVEAFNKIFLQTYQLLQLVS